VLVDVRQTLSLIARRPDAVVMGRRDITCFTLRLGRITEL
jgi:hypothetical protein